MYFRQFDKVPYDFNRDGVIQQVVNMFKTARVMSAFEDDVNTYTLYQVQNGERPDVVSLRLYDTPDYYWTFFVLNPFLHDGLAAWPMSQEKLNEYILQHYEGTVITTNPSVAESGDIGVILGQDDSLAGRFELGETITGNNSSATGKLVKKNIDMNQLVLQDVNGSFIGSSVSGPGNASESITGGTSGDSVNTYDVYKYIDAPHSYYRTDDPEKRVVTPAAFVSGGEPMQFLSFRTNRDYLFDSNEARSRIKIVNPKYIDKFVDAYEAIIKNV